MKYTIFLLVCLLIPAYADVSYEKGTGSRFLDTTDDNASGSCEWGNWKGFTAQIWFKVEDDLSASAEAQGHVLCDNWADTFYMNFYNHEGISQQLNIHLKTAGTTDGAWTGGTAAYRAAAPKIVKGRWYHCTFTYESGVDKVYMNGIEIYSGTDFSGTCNFATRGATGICVGSIYGAAYSTGMKVAEIRIWNRALTPAEVSWNWNRVMNTRGDGLQANWHSLEIMGVIMDDTERHQTMNVTGTMGVGDRPPVGY